MNFERKIKERPSFRSWLSDCIERSEHRMINSVHNSITDKNDPDYKLWRWTYTFIMIALWMIFLSVFDQVGFGPMLSCWLGLIPVISLTVYLWYLIDTIKLKRS